MQDSSGLKYEIGDTVLAFDKIAKIVGVNQLDNKSLSYRDARWDYNIVYVDTRTSAKVNENDLTDFEDFAEEEYSDDS